MSMQTDCIYGYGFKVYASDEQLKQFIEKHRDTIACLDLGRTLLDYMDRCEDDEFNPKEDFHDWENEATGDIGLYGMIADVMYKETGIIFEYRNSQDDEDDDVIILPQMYPWQMNDKEKILSQEALDNICNQYIKDLGNQLKPEFIRLEYFG